ncbi:hypothetical protein V1477_007447, partial [Vespula maculifrons]
MERNESGVSGLEDRRGDRRDEIGWNWAVQQRATMSSGSFLSHALARCSTLRHLLPLTASSFYRDESGAGDGTGTHAGAGNGGGGGGIGYVVPRVPPTTRTMPENPNSHLSIWSANWVHVTPVGIRTLLFCSFVQATNYKSSTRNDVLVGWRTIAGLREGRCGTGENSFKG